MKQQDSNKDNWIDSEKQRPEAGQKIITESAVGLFWGTFDTLGSGCVAVEGKYGLHQDMIQWDDIYRWIPYPKD